MVATSAGFFGFGGKVYTPQRVLRQAVGRHHCRSSALLRHRSQMSVPFSLSTATSRRRTSASSSTAAIGPLAPRRPFSSRMH